MSVMASQTTGNLIVCSIACSAEQQRKHQSSTHGHCYLGYRYTLLTMILQTWCGINGLDMQTCVLQCRIHIELNIRVNDDLADETHVFVMQHLVHFFNSSAPRTDKMAAILADGRFKYIFLNENDSIPIRISLKFVPRSPIDYKPALVQLMAWRRKGDKPLPESMLA